jgi:hypothetical protein
MTCPYGCQHFADNDSRCDDCQAPTEQQVVTFSSDPEVNALFETSCVSSDPRLFKPVSMRSTD